jgi:hypothetical protein
LASPVETGVVGAVPVGAVEPPGWVEVLAVGVAVAVAGAVVALAVVPAGSTAAAA